MASTQPPSSRIISEPNGDPSTSTKFMSQEAPPVHGQLIEHAGKQYKVVKEGRAFILLPPDAPLETDPKADKDGTVQASSVFYNPIQQYNRDLSVLAIRAFSEDYLVIAGKEQERKKARRRKTRLARKETTQHDGLDSEDTQRAPKRRRIQSNGGDEQPESASSPLRSSNPIEPLKPTETPEVGSNKDDMDVIEADEVSDDDLIACESSMAKQAVHQGPAASSSSTFTNGEDEKDLKDHIPPIRFEILDALSASGLRALRYANELSFVTSVTANDLSRSAVESMKTNIEYNKLNDRIRPVIGNANAHMYQSIAQEGVGGPHHQYQVIDLDPYGTAVPFLDAAVQAIADGGLLCVTCTDTGVFNSIGWLEKTFSLYGGVSVKGDFCAEAGLRLILHAIGTAAAKYGAAIEPLLSLSIDFYARVFVRVRKSPAEVKFLASKTMLVYNCDAGCGAWQTQHVARHSMQQGKKGNTYFKHTPAQGPTSSPYCSHCGFKTHLSGPMYGGPLHNPAFLQRILSYLPTLDAKTYPTVDRIEGMLTTALEETELYEQNEHPATESKKESDGIPRMSPSMIDHHPFYFRASSLSRVLHCHAPSDAQLKGALLHAGYRVTRSHTKPGTIKTDAPWSTLWKIMTEWIRQHSPLHERSLKETMAGWHILQKTGYFRNMKNTATAHDDSQATASGGELRQDIVAKGNVDITEKNGGTNPEENKIIFDAELGKDRIGKRLVRYQLNPRANWGPMSRAK